MYKVVALKNNSYVYFTGTYKECFDYASNNYNVHGYMEIINNLNK